MKIAYNWSVALVFALPMAWFIAFTISLLPELQLLPNVLIIVFGSLLLGFLVGGFLADLQKGMAYALIATQSLILFLGGIQLLLSSIGWATLYGHILLFLYFFLFGTSLILFTIFLNRLVPSIRRGRTASAVTILALVLASLLSFFWQLFSTPIAPFLTATIILVAFIIGVIIRPWRQELQTYMVPGSIGPFLLWWVIYLATYGLYLYASPSSSRILVNSLLISGSNILPVELVLLALSGAMIVFLFLPDKLGRKRVFTIASLLLGEIVLFGPAQYGSGIEGLVVPILFIAEIFVLAFIISVGAWLVWAEIGSVRRKGRRASLGWGLLGLLFTSIWIMVTYSIEAWQPFLIYPIAATLVLLSVLPLMNAIQILPNERVVEDIDVSVDSRQVSRALRDLEVDTSLKSIEDQIESELAQLMKIKGVTRAHAQTLRNAGYETPTLVANTSAALLASLLSIPEEAAAQILTSATALAQTAPKKGASMASSTAKTQKSIEKRKASKKKKA